MKQFDLKQDFLAIMADNYTIKCAGQTVYKVVGNGMKIGDQASFQTPDGKQLAYLAQSNNPLAPKKQFECHKDGKLWATCKQEVWNPMAKKEISIDIPGENDYKVTGDRLAWNFEVFLGDKKVGAISKEWGVTDSYGIRVEDDADEVDVLLCGVLVDAMYHNKDGKK
mmetsp:Transcript_5110/g.10733  ORF Transcript_5110/g.10733 Transcript_5110/m.10733 type:complete len:167 (+) Transcript_5110:176-676(+)